MGADWESEFGDSALMIAFDVYLNGEKVCTAGSDDLTSVTAAVNFFLLRRHRPAHAR
jgi:hypothetical protein